MSLRDLDSLLDWELAVVCLPPDFEWWDDDTLTIRDLVPIVGANNLDAVQRVAQRIWPTWEGQYKLQFPYVCRLLRKHLKDAKVRHSREELLKRAKAIVGVRVQEPTHGQ